MAVNINLSQQEIIVGEQEISGMVSSHREENIQEQDDSRSKHFNKIDGRISKEKGGRSLSNKKNVVHPIKD